jgi:hypothetical protein
MRKLFCPVCSTPEPTVKKVPGHERKSTGRRVLEWILFLIPFVGDFFLAAEIVTDYKKHPVAQCNKCSHEWDVKART